MHMESHHNEGVGALFEASKEPTVKAAIEQARAAAVPWGKILAALVSVLPAIAAGNWPAVVAAILALFQKPA